MLNVSLNSETPWSSGVALKIISALGGSSNTLVVGGAVRNWLLDENVNDIDLATKILPEKSMKLLSDIGLNVKPIGLDHGTIAVYENEKIYEITTLRKDILPDGRHSKVVFGEDWKEDALRRDFTINALYADEFGNIMDPTGLGYKDLEDKKIRFIGHAEERIKEDYLRILRYYRFLTKFSSNIDKASYEACLALSGGIRLLSGERIQAELSKIFEDMNLANIIKIFFKENLYKYVYSEECFNNLSLNEKFLDRIVNIILKNKNNINNPFLFFSCFLINEINTVNKDHLFLVKRISERLKISKNQQKYMLRLLGWMIDIKIISKNEIYKIWLDIGEEAINDIKLIYNIFNIKLNEQISFALNNKPPNFPCTGKDLKNIGLKEGQKFGIILSDVRDWWISKDCKPSYDECLIFLKNKIK